MADYRAISVVCEAILRLLRGNYKPELFDNQELEFKAATSADLGNQGMKAGGSLFLYHVAFNEDMHNEPTLRSTQSVIRLPKLPLDLYFLLTAWAEQASTQHKIIGWMLRVMADNPVLPATSLNAILPGSFQPEEAVEVIPLNLSAEELIHIWNGSTQSSYNLSIPYVARNIRIETMQSERT